MVESRIHDFTDFTCTNLMVKLKVVGKKLKINENFEFYTTREGYTNIEKIFNKKPFKMLAKKEAENKYYVKIWKI